MKILISLMVFFFLSLAAKAQDFDELSDPESAVSQNVISEENIEEVKTDFSNFYNTAVVQNLNKTTAKTSILEMKIGDVIRFGQIQIIAHKCWQAPLDQRPENKILLEVLENKEGKNIRIFYGWMFSSSPSISGLEHPIYDLTAINCKNK